MNNTIKNNFLGGSSAGFTLIEMLVVVLIIGILSAVALPQYQDAVEKSRVTEAMINARAILDGIQRFHQARPGEEVTSFNQIADVDLKGGQRVAAGVYETKNFRYRLHGTALQIWGLDNGREIYDFVYEYNPDLDEYVYVRCASYTALDKICRFIDETARHR